MAVRSRCSFALALCALIACHTTSSSQGGLGHSADGGAGAPAANGGSMSDSQAGSGDQADTRQRDGGGQGGAEASGGSGANAAQGGSQASNAVAGHGGTGGSQDEEAGAGGMGASGQGGDGAAAGGGGNAPPVCEPGPLCLGPHVDPSACGLRPMAIDAPVTSMTCPGMRTCTDAPEPRYRLVDFQRLSCGTNATYGLDAFLGRPTLVAIFGSWCPYCQAQTEKLDQLYLELKNAHKDIYIVIINQAGYESSQEELRSRSSMPMLQDTAAVNAWAIHGVEKDDLLIYRSDGTLEAWLPPGNANASIDLTTDTGYAYIQSRLMSTQ